MWGWRGEVTHTSNYKTRTRPRSLYPIFVFFLTYDTIFSFLRVFCRLTNGFSHLSQRLANYGPRAKSSPHSIVVNKVLLEHSHSQIGIQMWKKSYTELCNYNYDRVCFPHIRKYTCMYTHMLMYIYEHIHVHVYIHLFINNIHVVLFKCL